MTTTQLIIALTSLPVTYCIHTWFKSAAISQLRRMVKRREIIIANDLEYIRAMEKEIEVLKRRFEDLSFGFKKLEDSFKSAHIRRRNNFWRKNRKNAVR